ncbi:addiction module protein [Maribrevibacterium harenarium]|uniref:Addiction module protein n=2 Tax=Maribrevibacterium harenarium TaxID=2589817 RepID=A0A501X187_9GAMM|nr:addiction module protein [Maribrevibacterium harenarium]
MMVTLMNFQMIETEALHLPREDRVRLVEKLLNSLGKTSTSLDSEWLNEAKHRAEDIDAGRVSLIEGNKVLEKARKKLK